MFMIVQDGTVCNKPFSLNVAIDTITNHSSALTDHEASTFSVINEKGLVVASISNRKIIGNFYKQEWSGHRNDVAVTVGNEAFDATNAILLLPYSRLIELEDNNENTDELGKSFIDWDGPHHVQITSSICEYFGVDSIDEITEDNFNFVKSRTQVLEPISEIVTLQIRVQVNRMPGAELQDFLDNLDYDITSQTTGVVVSKTEIVESNIQEVAQVSKKSLRP